MGIIRESFIIFKNWTEAINKLPEKYQLEAYKALTQYGLTGTMPEKVSPYVEALLISFSVGMENSICRYNASVENGKKGGRPPKNQTQNANLEEPKITQQNLEEPNKTKTNQLEPNPNLNVNVNVNDNVNYIKERDIERKEQVEKFLFSLSQKFPSVEINTKEVSPNFDLRKIYEAVEQSLFLQKSPLTFILQHYDKVVSNYYKTIKKNENITFRSRSYSEEELSSLFDNLDEVEL